MESDSDVKKSTKRTKHSSKAAQECTNNDQINSESSKKKLSKRKQKKEKKLERIKAIQIESQKLAVEKALNYLSKWKHARSDWKFEKVRQNWLINNLYSEKCIPDKLFPILLEYLEGCKGMARSKALKKAQDIIEKLEADAENEEATDSIKHERARLLIQSLSN